jgi:hypothetical protein
MNPRNAIRKDPQPLFCYDRPMGSLWVGFSGSFENTVGAITGRWIHGSRNAAVSCSGYAY